MEHFIIPLNISFYMMIFAAGAVKRYVYAKTVRIRFQTVLISYYYQGIAMKENMGSADSYLRFMFGLTFFINIYILEPGAVGTVILLALGIAMWVQAWTHYCPAYSPINFSTTGAKDEDTAEEA